ncbi:helix-turn-helix domain-containing protein [uncultured Porticoccus sp.]|uniref:helix-turn-helix transcriptional regulator n=1 Tax=uncultured Porticoccus sp. TaxID=1256050 RepID=UPI00262A988B|nr:helix-turn-helix domain-containing protein [uncultured Porticoccus sp.]
MELDTPYQTIIEAARDWQNPIGDVIQAAGHGQFPLFVMANEWRVKQSPPDSIDGWVQLNSSDISKAIVSDHIVCKKVLQHGRSFVLEEPLEIMMGAVFVERVNPEASKGFPSQSNSSEKTKKLLTVKESADHLGLTRNTLDKYRVNGTGPKYQKVGSRSIRYTQEALDAWSDQN